MEVNNILVVCTGNICRSPMAKALLQACYPQKYIDSAGLAAVVGHPIQSEAIEVMIAAQMDIDGHYAKQITKDMAVAADGVEGAPAAAATAATEDLSVDVGAELYNKQCMACHANGLLNAPKYGDAAAWAPRIAKGKETLYTHASNGFNQMNAQVNAEVTEEQVHAAVDYMVAAAS